jgi:5-methylcytosine-specific restriction endonuclease McrA
MTYEEYQSYLKSPLWLNLRNRVLARAQDQCEGCGRWPATEVHHLTYAHVGQEFLWELRAVCRDCHDRLHPDKIRTPKPEPETKGDDHDTV